MCAFLFSMSREMIDGDTRNLRSDGCQSIQYVHLRISLLFYLYSSFKVETILLSVISMLADPNFESPANVDAAVSIFVIIIGRESVMCTRLGRWSNIAGFD